MQLPMAKEVDLPVTVENLKSIGFSANESNGRFNFVPEWNDTVISGHVGHCKSVGFRNGQLTITWTTWNGSAWVDETKSVSLS